MISLLTSFIAHLVNYLTPISGLLGVIVSARLMIATFRALRIKNRVRHLLHERYRSDPKFLVLNKAATQHNLTSKEIEEACSLIEVITKDLPPDDREVIEKGLHQVSSIGTTRYISNLLMTEC